MSAIICFMVSSGCAKREVLNLTIGEYIKALSDYTDKKDIYEIIEDLGDAENVVPTFNIRRQKRKDRKRGRIVVCRLLQQLQNRIGFRT